jgi:hypothetical protein
LVARGIEPSRQLNGLRLCSTNHEGIEKKENAARKRLVPARLSCSWPYILFDVCHWRNLF